MKQKQKGCCVKSKYFSWLYHFFAIFLLTCPIGGQNASPLNGLKNILEKIWFYCDNVLILRLKSKRSGGIELQPCFSRYILRANFCFFQHSPHPGSCKKAIAQKVLFSSYLPISLLAVWHSTEIVDSSTCIVGIIMLHASGASMLYRCGADVLSVERYAKAWYWDKTKIGIPHLFCF